MTLSSNLKNLREKLGYSQKELADLALVSQSVIGHIEANNRCPRTDTLQKIAKALGVTVSELLNETD